MTKSVKSCLTRLYADDTVIYKASANRLNAIAEIQTDIENYQTWCIQNKLSVNIAKTKVMVFTAAKYHPNSIDVNLKMDNQTLQVVTDYKYLGVILDNNLTFEKHINSVHKVVCFKTYQLSCLRVFLTVKMALQIFNTTILPYFDYADIIYMNAQLGHINKLQIDQNRCLKICLRLNRLTHTDFVHCEAKTPMLSDRRSAHLLNYMYIRSRDPDYIDMRQIGTRAHTGPMVNVLRSNCAAFDRSVGYQGAVCWNLLPPTRRKSETLSIFKYNTKKALKAKIPLVVG